MTVSDVSPQQNQDFALSLMSLCFAAGAFSPRGFTLEKNDGDVPARTKFYNPVVE